MNTYYLSDEKQEPKFGWRYTEYNVSSMDIMIPKNIHEMPDNWQFLYDEYGNYLLDREGCRLQQKNIIMMSNHMTRLTNDTPDKFSYWNKCIYSDIDSKKYFNSHEGWTDEKIDTLYKNVINYFITYYKDNFYYAEFSRSNKSFHFIFYFNTISNEDNFRFYTRLTTEIVREAFDYYGYKDVLEYPEVMDAHSYSICQVCYITKNKAVFNNSCTGNIVNYKLTEYVNQSIIKEKEEEAIKTLERIARNEERARQRAEGYDFIAYLVKTDIWSNSYISHTERFKLFTSLYFFFPDNIETIWSEVAEHIKEDNGHSTRYYKRCPFVNDWYNKLKTGKTQPFYNKSLLEQFGYRVMYKQK